ncbi:MAG TPA: hypothetical protein VMC10_05645 [Stellaceae bacterium]|nr:hypothetical protein [Stellaceae bacterium]
MKPWAIGAALGAVVVIAAVGGGIAVDRYAERLAEDSLATMLLPAKGGATHGAMHYSLLADRFEVDTVAAAAVDAPWKSIRIGHLTLDGVDPLGIKHLLFGPHSGPRPIARTVILADAAIEVPEGGHYEAKTLTLVDPVSLDPAAIAGLGSDYAGAVRALAGLSATRVEFENYRYAFPSRGRHGFAEHVTAEAIGGGKIARVEIRGLAADAETGAQQAHYEVDRIDATGIDIAAAATLLDQRPEALTDQTFYKPVETISWDGLQLAAGPLEATVHHAEVRGVKLRRLVTALAGTAALAPERAGELFSAIAFEKVEYAGLDARAAGKDAVHLTIGRLMMSDLAPGSLGGFALDSMTAETTAGRLALGSLALEGLVYRPRSAKARAALAAMGFPPNPFDPGRIFVRHFALRDLASEAGGHSVLTLKSIESRMAGSIDMATDLDFKLDDLVIDLSRLPPSAAGFSPADLGITELVLDIDLQSRYDSAAKMLTIPRYAFVLPKLGSLVISLDLGDLAIDPSSDDPAQALQRLLLATLRHLEIRYEDDSFADRLIAYSAKRANQDVDTFRAALIAQLEAQARAILVNTPRAQMLDAVIAFLKSPQAITISIEPPKPLTLATLSRLPTMNPNDVPALLGLSIK